MSPRYRFSGHETFPCRYAWLPKAYRALNADPKTFADEDSAIVALGVGKNMVRAIRFWVQAAGVAMALPGGGYEPTPFGHALFGPRGRDPFLEDIRTLWLLHWQLSTNVEEPLFAWDYLLNRWAFPEISRTEALRTFTQEAIRLERNLSVVTLEQHFDTFLHTYVPTRSRKGEIQEDNLDCPLVELALIEKVGERQLDRSGKREPIYSFRRDRKPTISPGLFVYCLNDFWSKYRPSEATLSFRDLSVAPGSPGQIFKLSEQDLRERLETLERDSQGVFQYRESAALQQVIRGDLAGLDLLVAVYDLENDHATDC